MASRPETVPIPNLSGYTFGEKLGAGSYGTVYKARLLNNVPSSAANVRPIYYAIKCILRRSLNKTTQDLLINEIKLLKKIKHENIVEMYDFQWDENYIYIVMEYCAGGDMSKFLRSRQKLSEARARPFVQQIARVIKFLHERQISHMDLKPENILLTSTDRPTLKVADFGVAQHIGKHGSRSVRGTLLYMAPEILSSTPYDNRVDLWSIGVILYECLFGRPLFIFSTIDELLDAIKSRVPIEIPADAEISPECRDLLIGLLKRNPNNRISFHNFFHHAFIANDLSMQITRADDFFQRSLHHEQNGNLKKALDYRVRALDEYVAIIKVDENADRRKSLRTKINQGLIAAETLKKRIRQVTPSSPPELPTTTINATNLDLSNDKSLSEAYQHCLNGNQLMNVFQYGQACEEYQMGLQVMLKAAQTETDPVKNKILHDVISCYLNKAEHCKEKNESRQIDVDMAKIQEDSVIGATTAEESNATTDKRSFTATTQNCCLQ